MKQLTAQAKEGRPHPLRDYWRVQAPLVRTYNTQYVVNGITQRHLNSFEQTVGNITQYEGFAASAGKTRQEKEKELATLREFYTARAAEVGLSLAVYCNRFGVRGVLCAAQTNPAMKW